VAQYRQALKYWDHPGIHYNLMLALVSVDQPVEAYESAVAALRHGYSALQPEEYERARNYKKLLRQQLAKIEVICTEPGAVVTLDGKPLFTGPDQVTRLVPPGTYQFMVSKPGHVTAIHTAELEPGETSRVELALMPLPRGQATRPRWAKWKPWTMVGAGAALALTGATLQWRASENAERANELFREYCPSGCPERLPDDLVRVINRSDLQWTLATGTYVTAGAVIATGVALVVLNGPRPMDKNELADGVGVTVAPAPGGGWAAQIAFTASLP
jgi:hypothetical protein